MLSELVYRPLDATRKEIRILYVEVEDELDSNSSTPPPITPIQKLDKIAIEDTLDSPVQPRLRLRFDTISLTDLQIPFYEAISYCWNDSKERTNIYLDGVKFNIPEKAEATLRAICNDHGHTPVWLDAVCINQNDPNERNQQAALMGEIYSKAARALVWLGHESGFAGRAASSVRDLRSLIGQTFAIDWLTPHLWSSQDDAVGTISNQFPFVHSWQAVYALYANRWFTTAWIIAEVTASKQVVCYLGQQRMEWSELASLGSWLHRHRAHLPLCPSENTLIGVANTEDIWAFQCRESKIFASLQQLVASFDEQEPKDMAQAILELRLSDQRAPSGGSRSGHEYDESMSDVYAKAARAAIVDKGNLSLLKHSQSLRTLTGRGQQDGFPSWALRLDLRDYSFLNPISCRSFQFNTNDSIPLCLAATSDFRILRAQGMLVEEIVAVSPHMHWPLKGNRQMDAATAANVMRKTFGWSRRALPKWPETALARKFAFTVAAGQDVGGRNLAVAGPYGKKLHRGFMDIAPISVIEGPLRLESTQVSSNDLNRDAMYAVEAMMKSGQNRTIFTTASGRIGLGTDNLLPGDNLCILFGGNVPFILRPDNGYWRYIGDAFVEGIMFVSALPLPAGLRCHGTY